LDQLVGRAEKVKLNQNKINKLRNHMKVLESMSPALRLVEEWVKLVEKETEGLDRMLRHGDKQGAVLQPRNHQ